jgi:transposase
MNISVVGIDLSKNIFHVVGINHRGKIIVRKKCSRIKLISEVLKFSKDVLICMETCQGAHNWCRELKEQGYNAKQIAAQHVKKYAKNQKNDYNDAEAIALAGSMESTKFVPTKSRQQQEHEALMSVRDRLMNNRTALMNQARGLLAEQGVSIPKSRNALVRYIETEMLEIGELLRKLAKDLMLELIEIEDKIEELERQIEYVAKTNDEVKRLKTIPGVGTFTALALSTMSGNPKEFKNGRQFSANLGLVPKQHSTGGKTVLGGITKNGDRMRRSLLFLGAHAVIRQVVGKKKENPHSLWIRKLYDKKGANLTAVALANKNARVAWRILTNPGMTYSEQLCHCN